MMTQTVTIKLKLYKPTHEKQKMYQLMTDRVTAFANKYISLEKKDRPKTSKQAKQYSEPLPSAVLTQAIRDINGKKDPKHFKRLWCNFNNQNFKVEKENGNWKVSFPTLEKRIGVPIETSERQNDYLEKLINGEVKQGTAMLVKRRGRWYIHLSFEVSIEEEPKKREKIMGIDLGLIDILVAEAEGQTLFFSGGKLAYMRRHFKSLRSRLMKAKAYKKLKELGNKEHRIATDINHKISSSVIDFAKEQGVTKIRMEDLTDARWEMKQRKKQKHDSGRSLQSWSFYQLQEFIEYKATLTGIEVEYVNKDNTSMICSVCGHKFTSRPKGRMFECPSCGSIRHIDANAARNIAEAISGIAS